MILAALLILNAKANESDTTSIQPADLKFSGNIARSATLDHRDNSATFLTAHSNKILLSMMEQETKQNKDEALNQQSADHIDIAINQKQSDLTVSEIENLIIDQKPDISQTGNFNDHLVNNASSHLVILIVFFIAILFSVILIATLGRPFRRFIAQELGADENKTDSSSMINLESRNHHFVATPPPIFQSHASKYFTQEELPDPLLHRKSYTSIDIDLDFLRSTSSLSPTHTSSIY